MSGQPLSRSVDFSSLTPPYPGLSTNFNRPSHSPPDNFSSDGCAIPTMERIFDAPEIVLLVFQACDTVEDCLSLASTCKFLASVWRMHTAPILRPLLEANTPGFNQALLAVSCLLLLSRHRFRPLRRRVLLLSPVTLVTLPELALTRMAGSSDEPRVRCFPSQSVAPSPSPAARAGGPCPKA